MGLNNVPHNGIVEGPSKYFIILLLVSLVKYVLIFLHLYYIIYYINTDTISKSSELNFDGL